jgi:hypothetical protein
VIVPLDGHDSERHRRKGEEQQGGEDDDPGEAHTGRQRSAPENWQFKGRPDATRS